MSTVCNITYTVDKMISVRRKKRVVKNIKQNKMNRLQLLATDVPLGVSVAGCQSIYSYGH